MVDSYFNPLGTVLLVTLGGTVLHLKSLWSVKIAVLAMELADNWDLEVKARYQTKSQTNKSLHYFHAYAVKHRVVAYDMDHKEPQKSILYQAIFSVRRTLKTLHCVTKGSAWRRTCLLRR